MNPFSKLAFLAAVPRLITSRRALRHVCGNAMAACHEIIGNGCNLATFPKVSLNELIAGCDQDTRISLAFFPQYSCSISPLESLCLALLIRKSKAKRVFEFGTYLGISTTQIALNVSEESAVFTLDLPEDDPRARLQIDDSSEVALTVTRDKGRLVPGDLVNRVVFLKKDSADLDVTPYLETMDLVFVDGAHSLDYVRNDSEKGWQMLRAGGIIAWHDCRPDDPDVVRYLLNCPYRPCRINGTTLAFAQKGK